MTRLTSRFRTAAALLLVPVFAAAQAPREAVDAIAAETRRTKVMDHLDHLTNKIGPRLTGSERLQKACEWARDQFASFGIANARLEEWGTVDVGFDRGTHRGYMKHGDATTPLTFGTNAWTPGTDGLKEAKAVLGPMDAGGIGELKTIGGGCWIVRPAKTSVRTEIDAVAKECGALGVVAGTGPLILTGGNHLTKWDELPTLVRINLLRSEFEDVVKHLEAGEDVRLGFDVQNRFKQGPIPLYNVIADIRGTEKPDEMVIVGGHIDSWDGATGTTDNGTGVATTLEAARLLMASGARPKRTIRFMLWSGEEQGLLGSVAWIKNHPDELDKISAVLVHDGGTNYVSGIVSTPQMLPAMTQALEPVFAALGISREAAVKRIDAPNESRPSADGPMEFVVREVKALPRGIGSDHDAFLARGVPGFFWRQAGRANYTRTHHTQHDTFDAAIPEYQTRSSFVIALGALGIANLDEMLPRSKDMSGRPNAVSNRRRLGVNLGGDDESDLTIGDFREGSRAEAAGMKTGDRIVKIDGVKVGDTTELSDALNLGAPKKTITVLRKGKEHELTIEWPAPESRRSE